MIEIYTDGSANYKTGDGGWAFYIPSLNVRLSGSVKSTTNNRMEVQAVIEAIKFVEDNDMDEDIKILSDSEYTIKSFTVYWRSWVQNNWMTSTGSPVKNKDLMEKLIEHSENPKYTLEWVKAHAKSEGNIEADRLAYLAYTDNKELLNEKAIVVLSKSQKETGRLSVIYNEKGEELERFSGLGSKQDQYVGFRASELAQDLDIRVIRTDDSSFLKFKYDTPKKGDTAGEWDKVRSLVLHGDIKFLPLINQVHQISIIKFEEELARIKKEFYKTYIPPPPKHNMKKSNYFEKF